MSPQELVRQIHVSAGKAVIALSGGGSGALADLLETPGASRTLIEAVVPYCEPAMIAWLGGRPDQFCSAETARAMAMAAFVRACKLDSRTGRDQRSRPYDPGEPLPAGIACTAGLATDRPRRGAHRAHLAVQTADCTATWSIELRKGRRTRPEEEQLVSRILLNTVAEACHVDARLELDLLERERVDCLRTVAPQPWQDLLLGKIKRVDRGNQGKPIKTVFPGAFSPLHTGHRRMIAVAEEILGAPVTLEISIINVDKPPLDYHEIERRLGQFDAGWEVCLTRAPTFDEKSRLFPGATFIVGADTLRRIADPRYHGDDRTAWMAALKRIADRGCRFLAFGRDTGTGFVGLPDLDLPDILRPLCREVPQDVFREDVSSTAIRRSKPQD